MYKWWKTIKVCASECRTEEHGEGQMNWWGKLVIGLRRRIAKKYKNFRKVLDKSIWMLYNIGG